MMEAMGVDRVVAVDLHCGQIQGFFGPRVPVDNVEAQIVGLDYFESKELDKPVVVSPDAGGVYRYDPEFNPDSTEPVHVYAGLVL